VLYLLATQSEEMILVPVEVGRSIKSVVEEIIKRKIIVKRM